MLQTLNAVKDVVEELNAGIVGERGLVLVQSFDASVFIYRAINLVTSNLLLGVLATGVLWWFLRRLRATLIVASRYPDSLLATFILLKLTGDTLNVISLAGPGLCHRHGAGCRHRGAGEHRAPARARSRVADAAAGGHRAGLGGPAGLHRHHRGDLPAGDLHARDVEGQLFGDLAMTIAIAVVMSLLVAVTILPLASHLWLTGRSDWRTACRTFWRRIAERIMRADRTRRRRRLLAAGLLVIPLVHQLAADAGARLPAAGEARRGRRLLPVPRRRQHKHASARNTSRCWTSAWGR